MNENKTRLDIIKGVPYVKGALEPGVREARGRPAKYNWVDMKVGDAVYIEGVTEGKKALNSAYQYARKVWAREWLKDNPRHPNGHWGVVGRRVFAGKRYETGWMIWRLENTPLVTEDIDYDSHGQPWCKDEPG